MRKFILVLAVLVCSLMLAAPAMAGDLCFNCGSGSSNGCKQCKSRSGKDTQQDRKTCKDLGCKITGTGSCSTAANVKVCQSKSDTPDLAVSKKK
jgi:hypothetical protein